MIKISLSNIVITSLISGWYSIYEPIALKIARFFFEGSYRQKGEKPLVSIIIATYNRSTILVNRTLPSILSQTYPNIEVVIIGDKCIDNTPELLCNFPDPRVRFFDLKKRGRYPANIKDRWFVQGSAPRNKGMKLARGKWFVFISDDDIMLPHHVETLVAEAERRDVEFISASYETVKNGKIITVHPSLFGMQNQVLIGGMQTWLYRSYLRLFEWNIHAWRKSWNRPVDYDLQLRFINAGVRIGSINTVVYFNPPVEGTNTTGYEAAIQAETEESKEEFKI